MKQALDATARGLRTFVSDVVDGFFEITHNSFALLGLATVFAVLALAARPDLRQTGEEQLMGWLQSRKPAPEVTESSQMIACSGMCRSFRQTMPGLIQAFPSEKIDQRRP